ncbi:MAG TPA: glycosyltransferase [Edaphobacter sp.]|nr:glycosyltransferase [Edaphobacter sp.]
MKTVFRKALERGKETIRPYYLRWLYFPLFPNLRPEHFQDCWRYPSQTIARNDSRAPSQPPALLFFPMTDWHTRIQRTQHLARTFASLGHQCFYLNPHLGREFPNPYFFSSSPKLHILEPLIAELHIHLPFEPVFHDRLLSAHENTLIVNALKTVFDAEGTTKLVQMVSFPLWIDAAQKLREQFGFPIAYDCHDVLSGFRKISREIVEKEPALFKISDVVVFSSQELLNENVAQYPYLKDKSILVRNAVDESWLSRSEADRKGSAGNGSEIIVGYVGALDFWFDVDAVEKAARAHPNWKFLLIGRVEDKRILRLGRLPNIVFVGEVPHSELHKYMAMFRVALIPFLRNDLTIGTNPIKLYEYFSYGLPVVSTDLPEMDEFKVLLYLYDQPGQFTEQLEKAVAEKDAFLRQSRIGIAHRESWNARVKQLSEAFLPLL